ncbi:MAG: U32 family peptidase [Clostridia bacterium]|nr:U32 family peptidase [Clostridia bacterium]
MELLAPAGNFEAAVSAVRNGADAIYLGGKTLNARRAACGFDGDALKEIVAYCHLRKVKVYVTVNTLVREEEMEELYALAEDIAKSGADAAIVSDLGAAKVLHELCPSLPLHASTQMNIHSESGILFLKELGFSRVVLARELPLEQIASLCKCGLEIEVFAHGALCMSCSGNCLFSAVAGQKSGNRGLCAQPCRLPYEGGQYPLSLKDLCTLEHLSALKEAGVASLKIEGRLKSPEYVGSVTAAYRNCIDGAPATQETITQLAHIFARGGFTAGYLTGRLGPQMFGTKTKTEYADYKAAVAAVSKTLEEGYEPKKRGVSFYLIMREGYCRLETTCDGYTFSMEPEAPAPALKREITEEDAARSLGKLGGTPFYLEKFTARIEHDLFYSAAAFNALRREALSRLTAHFAPKAHPFIPQGVSPVPKADHQGEPRLEGWYHRPENLRSDALARLDFCWLNAAKPEQCIPFGKEPKCGVFFPAFISEKELLSLASTLYGAGFRHGLIRNIGQILPLQKMGFTLHGDYGLNLANGHSLRTLAGHLSEATLSFELTLKQLRQIPKPLPAGIIVYGRLPLMETVNCILKNVGPCRKGAGGTITDRTGRRFPIACGHRCTNTLFNNAPLFLADRNREWQSAGVAFGRLLFTDERPDEIMKIILQYRKGAKETPEEYTRGLYYRGVW